jgi:hypothetical protein
MDRRSVWREGKTYNVYTIRWQNVQAAFDKLAEERIARKNGAAANKPTADIATL